MYEQKTIIIQVNLTLNAYFSFQFLHEQFTFIKCNLRLVSPLKSQPIKTGFHLNQVLLYIIFLKCHIKIQVRNESYKILYYQPFKQQCGTYTKQTYSRLMKRYSRTLSIIWSWDYVYYDSNNDSEEGEETNT